MLSRRRFLALLGATSATAGAAAISISLLPGGSAGTGDGPPTIRYGEDSCATCGMVIADPRFAAAWRDSTGKAARFDDIGCMVTKLHDEATGFAPTFYVHDYGDEAWIDAAPAAFVVSPEIKSPMAYGIAAFVSPERAAALATSHSTRAVDWAAVRAGAGNGGSM